ncbi:MAG: SpaA isopeptide-forming pilin-related protein, partial [Clostridia bacterium]
DENGAQKALPNAGRAFTLTNAQGQRTAYTTDAQGQWAASLPAGDYLLDAQPIVLRNGQVSSVALQTASSKGRIALLSEAPLTLSLATKDGVFLQTLSLTPHERCVSMPLDAGTYRLTCTSFPDVYDAPAAFELSVKETTLTAHRLQLHAHPQLSVRIQTNRLRADGSMESLPAAHLAFTLSQGKTVQTLKTDAQGAALLSLPAGDYVLAASGYAPQTVSLSEGRTPAVLERTEATGVFQCRLIGHGTAQTPLANIRFTLTDTNGRSHAFSTDADGLIACDGLMPGAYTLTQINAPAGYTIDSPNQTVLLRAGEITRIDCANSQNGAIRVTALGISLDAQCHRRMLPLMGTLTVYTRIADAYLPYPNADAPLQVIAHGEAITLPTAAQGVTYYLHCDDPIQGFIPTQDFFPVIVRPGLTTLSALSYHSDRGLFSLSHRLVGTGKPLTGGLFALEDADGHTMFSFTTDDQGNYLSQTPVAAGRYTIRLLRAAEGTLYFGALAASVVAIYLQLPPVLHVILCIAVAVLAGGAAMLIPALLKTKLGASEMVSSLMLNYILLQLGVYLLNYFYADRTQGATMSYPFQPTAKIAKLVPKTNLSWGIVIALVMTVIVSIFLYRTKWGYAIRIVGLNKSFAKYSGIKVGSTVLMCHVIGGMLAGMGGAVEVLGYYNRFEWKQLPGYGWDGVTIAFLAKNNPILVP